jgi:hypothetical protein
MKRIRGERGELDFIGFGARGFYRGGIRGEHRIEQGRQRERLVRGRGRPRKRIRSRFLPKSPVVVPAGRGS